VATPNFYVFEMYKPHQGATAIRVKVEAPGVAFQAGNDRRELFGVAGSASVREKALTLTVVNPHVDQPAAVQERLKGGLARSARRTVLTHKEANAHNTFENPDEVVSRSDEAGVSGASFTLELPPKSVTRWDVALG